jgi:DNA repair exonuclease SbcCD nuclease subunit
MKIAICSDVHLEFGQLELKNTENAEVLILSGDICVASDLMYNDMDSPLRSSKSNTYHEFFQSVCSEFPKVIYIMGNHEHYHGDFAYSCDILRDRLDYIENLHILDEDTLRIGDVTFIGGTLWTDMNGEDFTTACYVARMMNDFRVVKNSNNLVTTQYSSELVSSRFTPNDAVISHKSMLKLIDSTIKKNPENKFVVVGHHAPSKLSTHPRYKEDVEMNGGYSSDLDFFIEDHPQILCWTHGHTHEPFDYFIGSTRIVCNPRGYINHEERADFFELKFIDV